MHTKVKTVGFRGIEYRLHRDRFRTDMHEDMIDVESEEKIID